MSAPAATAGEITIFGVRHLSPGVAWHLRQFLDLRRPKWVLIEGSSDMDQMIPFITDPRCKLPIAALAFTMELPVETILFPWANYSPEYQALLWATEHRAEVRFIDLPASVFLALEVERKKRLLKRLSERREAADGGDPGAADEELEERTALRELGTRQRKIEERVAEMGGEFDYESYWEGNFETLSQPEPYRAAMLELGRTFRELEGANGTRLAETLVREAYMRRQIRQVLDAGARPEDVVAIVGAYHAPVLTSEHPPMTDEELARLPHARSTFTLMPFSYYKLSTQSGYGAGNLAPAYFELLWDSLREGRFEQFPSEYLSRIARDLRERGTFRSTAEVIEGCRLAQSLAEMHGRRHPVKAELRDAAVTLLGQGHYVAVADSMKSVDVGTEIGVLPPDVAQTSIQEDFTRELNRLKLAKYRTGVEQELGLDLRENRRVASREAAFLDLDRSSFFHRLLVLSIPFATEFSARQESANWAESWKLKWIPESEIALVEAVLMGETVEVAAAFAIERRLDETHSVQEAARLVRLAAECALPAVMDRARLALRSIAAESSKFDDLAFAAREMAFVVRYGDVRRFSVEHLRPLVEQLFRESVLHLLPSANCDGPTAAIYLQAMDQLNRIALEYSTSVDEKLWETELLHLSNSDAHHPLLSGFACAILLERGLIDDHRLSAELSRRLSPGIDADMGAGWFEGLARRNRYALLSRLSLWRHLESYIHSLDEAAFKRSLVFLRRAFESFNAHERRQIGENLGEIWGVHEDVATEALEKELTEKESEELKDLTSFDFGDL